ncbi:hypothetical protein GYMLUDRAFT_46899, partial [Collybiopsis luxurians FD-317 M1]
TRLAKESVTSMLYTSLFEVYVACKTNGSSCILRRLLLCRQRSCLSLAVSQVNPDTMQNLQ